MNSLGRKSSFRTPRMKKVTKTPSSVSTFAVPSSYENHMITPMLSKKSELWRGSVEVISDVELTQSDTELVRSSVSAGKREKRKRAATKNCLSGFAMKSGPVSDNPIDWDTPSLAWKRFYLVTSDSILVLSNPSTFLLDQRMKLANSRIREVRLRGRGVLFVKLHGEPSGFLLRFRDRAERRQWYSILQAQSLPTKLPPRSAFPSMESLPPAKRQMIPDKSFPITGSTVSVQLNNSFTPISTQLSTSATKPRRRSAAMELFKSVKNGFRDLTKPLKRRSSIRLASSQ